MSVFRAYALLEDHRHSWKIATYALHVLQTAVQVIWIVDSGFNFQIYQIRKEATASGGLPRTSSSHAGVRIVFAKAKVPMRMSPAWKFSQAALQPVRKDLSVRSHVHIILGG